VNTSGGVKLADNVPDRMAQMMIDVNCRPSPNTNRVFITDVC